MLRFQGLDTCPIPTVSGKEKVDTSTICPSFPKWFSSKWFTGAPKRGPLLPLTQVPALEGA